VRTLKEDALRQAMQNNHKKAIRLAVGEAREAGVGRGMVDAAVLQMGKIELEDMLRLAIDSGNPDIVQAAIAKARRVGAAEPIVLKAEHAKKHLGVRKSLRVALNSQNPDMLSFAIGQAQEAAVEEHVIQEAVKILPVLDLRRRLKKAVAGKDPAVLIKALVDANHCVEENPCEAEQHLAGLIAKAETRLSSLKDQANARGILAKAIAAGVPEQLRFSITIAQHMELDICEVERAELLLQQTVARGILEDTIGTVSPSPRALNAALAMGKSAGLPQQDLQSAQELLWQLEAKRPGNPQSLPKI